jgi:hypothetical protein
VHADSPKDSNAELEDLVAAEPPFTHPAIPKYFDRYMSILGRCRPAAHNFWPDLRTAALAPIHERSSADRQRSEEGCDFVRSLSATGLSAGLFELGFRDVADFWPPWCVAVVDGEIASIAFAARLSDLGAELGLATAKAFRGRGFAAAATAGWSRLPSLQSRVLFYSTDRNNISSQRVVARLRLQPRGASLRISRPAVAQRLLGVESERLVAVTAGSSAYQVSDFPARKRPSVRCAASW